MGEWGGVCVCVCVCVCVLFCAHSFKALSARRTVCLCMCVCVHAHVGLCEHQGVCLRHHFGLGVILADFGRQMGKGVLLKAQRPQVRLWTLGLEPTMLSGR